jgi:Double-GTPase 2
MSDAADTQGETPIDPEAPPAPEILEERPPADSPQGGVDDRLAEARLEGEGGYARGEALSAIGAGRVAAESRTTVVVLLGGWGSGKTTLLASVYERFGLGKLAGHWFLGSRTLHGFERRCHRSIHGQGPGDADTGHTSEDAPPWLHLRTARQETPGRVYELLLGDFSGDHHTKPLADRTRKPSQFRGLRRADHVCLTINGGAIALPQGRSAEQRLQIDLLSALLDDPDGIADPSAISFIVTKWDLIHRAGDEARDAVESLFADLRGMLDDRGAGTGIGYLETAARSSVPELPLGYGVGDMLSRWTDRPAVHICHDAPRVVGQGSFERYIGGATWS